MPAQKGGDMAVIINRKPGDWRPSIIIFSKPIQPSYAAPPPKQLWKWVFFRRFSWNRNFSLLIHSIPSSLRVIIQLGLQTHNHSWQDNLSWWKFVSKWSFDCCLTSEIICNCCGSFLLINIPGPDGSLTIIQLTRTTSPRWMLARRILLILSVIR